MLHRFFLFSLCLFVANQAVAAPRIVCDSPKYDFGTVIGQDKIEHAFVLTNKGNEPVKISSIKNCCGVSSEVHPMEILPGSNAVCRSVFTTKNRYGKQEKQILLATNDRKKPYVELRMTGTLKRFVDVSPRMVRFSDLTSGSQIDAEILVTNLLDQAVELESVVSMVEGIRAEVVGGIGDPAAVGGIGDAEGGEQPVRDRRSQLQTDPVRGHRPRLQHWTVRLSSDGHLEAGRLTGMIKLNFSTGTITVPVMGTVKPSVQVVPEKISLSRSSDKPVERLIMIRSADSSDLSSVSAELLGVEGSVVIKKLSEKKWQLKANLLPSSAMADSCIRISTPEKHLKDITIPLMLK
jgi:hypothetical protein